MACAATRYFFISIRLSPTLRVTPLLSKYSSSGSAYFLLLPVASRTAASVMSPSIEEILSMKAASISGKRRKPPVTIATPLRSRR